VTDDLKDKQQAPNDGRPWLMIAINADNTVKVSGHVDDRVLSYGLLSVAKDTIKEWVQEQRPKLKASILAHLNRGKQKHLPRSLKTREGFRNYTENATPSF